MKVEVKKVDATRREIKFEIPKERVVKRLEEVYADISKVAKIRGFRPGKAPRHIVEQEHGKIAQEKMMESLIPEVYQEAVKQESLAPIDFPEISDVQYKDGILCFKASLDIQPDFT
ncbi:MAG: trigger factor family protein, partial [Candidatus Omnitrophota bacterium]